MPVACKLIFGVRTARRTRLEVTSQPPSPAPDLLIRREGTEIDERLEFRDGAWTTDLEAGDHIVRLDLPNMPWFDAKVSFKLDPEAICVVYRGSFKDPPSEHLTIAWQAGSGSASDRDGDPAAGSDPKDPWPPPGAQTMPIENSMWFTRTLYDLGQNITNPRSGRPPPRRDA